MAYSSLGIAHGGHCTTVEAAEDAEAAAIGESGRIQTGSTQDGEGSSPTAKDVVVFAAPTPVSHAV